MMGNGVPAEIGGSRGVICDGLLELRQLGCAISCEAVMHLHNMPPISKLATSKHHEHVPGSGAREEEGGGALPRQMRMTS